MACPCIYIFANSPIVTCASSQDRWTVITSYGQMFTCGYSNDQIQMVESKTLRWTFTTPRTLLSSPLEENTTLSSDGEGATHLLLRHLLVLVHVQGVKQLLGAFSQPDEQVAGGDALRQVYQLQLKHQHRAARHSGGWERDRDRETDRERETERDQNMFWLQSKHGLFW